MTIRRRTVALALAGAATAGTALVGPASPASAYPSGCWHSTAVFNAGVASCASGTGSYRAVIGCRNPFGWWANRYGPWYTVGNGNVSRATCPAGYIIQWTGFNARD